ncbi:MAG: flagellar protein FlgN [Candidatus Pristimantibacillus lignocellulolyticus]|uniref:Flagellar protein FlgN n=1 Tax=Candidatus Pristimantibacillus lignocellulolyticus TaxID=2994561 RepID=A0A9J6ZIR4_9BACL|nr:MAG: flagellar protein FlgN [Candidatus Pristimantibacillus lignocellulolyticus]
MEQSAFQLLISQLRQLLLIYRALFTLADEKKRAIIENNIELINALTMKETKALKPVPELEAVIRTQLTKLQRDLGFRPKLKMTLSEMTKMLVIPEEKQELADIQVAIADISTKLSKANQLNQQLIQQSLEYVHFSLDVLCGPPDEEVTYKRPTMNTDVQKRTGIYDTRA